MKDVFNTFLCGLFGAFLGYLASVGSPEVQSTVMWFMFFVFIVFALFWNVAEYSYKRGKEESFRSHASDASDEWL